MTDPKHDAAEDVRPEVRYEIVDRIAYITLDRPAARNAINPAVRQGLIDRSAMPRSIRTCGSSCSPAPAIAHFAPAPI